MIKNWSSFNGFNVTLNTTEDCNLRCKYCYEICKRPGNMSLTTAKLFLDKIFDDPDPVAVADDETRKNEYDGLIIDFIGGDSLMNVNILDQICRYANTKFNLDKSNKFKKNGWRLNIATNGTLFAKPEVRAFCEKWYHNLSLGVSIDGCPEIHDMNRIFVDGRGSMETIMKWWPWYKNLFPVNARQTKATCNKESIPYLFESLKWMHEELGLTWINQNFVMEDLHLTQADLDELDKQLEKCCEYCVEHRNDLYWGIFDFRFQFPYNSMEEDEYTWHNASCGAGQMPACGINGDVYPCFRWLPHTHTGEAFGKVGNIYEEINKDVYKYVREHATNENCTKDDACRHCKFESACTWCTAGSYAEFRDWKRATHICEITKLQCKWAQEYVRRLEKLENENSKI